MLPDVTMMFPPGEKKLASDLLFLPSNYVISIYLGTKPCGGSKIAVIHGALAEHKENTPSEFYQLSSVQNPSIIPFYWLVYTDSPVGLLSSPIYWV